jgi:hypothetical protein
MRAKGKQAAGGTGFTCLRRRLPARSKSFLLLFFKKEVLPVATGR